ncbi:MAG: radical SAM protein [Hydrogenoanaerobacterium sp.]
MNICTACPRRCGVYRKEHLTDNEGELGFCGMPQAPVLARAALHLWEEPCISGTRGSGTVFFSGCSLRCCFCQNHKISAGGFGQEINTERLRQIYFELIAQGAHNINLVNPTHFTKAIAESLNEPLPVPVIYNCGGYESVESLQALRGKIQIYIPDLKYSDSAAALKYSFAEDYYETAKKAIDEMLAQTGKYIIDKDGIMQSGVIIRHLILPENLENTFGVIDYICEHFKPGEILFSLMRQYTPYANAALHPEINRILTAEEYKRAEDYLLWSGAVDGFLQEDESATDGFIPKFDLTGVM